MTPIESDVKSAKPWTLAPALIICLALALSAPNARAAILSEQDVDNDGEKEIVLENAFARLTLKLSCGAATSLAIKPSGIELAKSSPKSPGAILNDIIWQQGQGDFINRPYDCKVAENTDKLARVTLWRRGETEKLRWITITKTITMRSDTPAIDVDYEIANEEASKETYSLGLWINNYMSVTNEEAIYTIPLPTGLTRRSVTSGPSGGTETWSYDIVRGWVSIHTESGSGAAFFADYTRLMAVYQWMKGNAATLELLYRSQAIPNDGSFSTRVQIIPFSGLPYVDGVIENHAGCIFFPQAPAPGQLSMVRVLLSPGPGKIATRVYSKRLPDGVENLLGEAPLAPDTQNRLVGETSFTAAEDGTYVVRAEIIRDGKIAGEFEQPVVIGKPSGRYMLQPLQKRLGDDKEVLEKSIPLPDKKSPATAAKNIPVRDAPPDIELKEGIATPHIPWANPYYMGKTKVFVIVNTEAEREVIELAERMSVDFKRVTHGKSGWKVPCELVKTWNDAASEAHQKRILEKEPLDAIIMNCPWDAVAPSVQALILKRVEGGTGLVVVSPRNQGKQVYGAEGSSIPPDISARMPVSNAGRDCLAQWQQGKKHFITTGIPLEHFKTMVSTHSNQTGTVLAEALFGNQKLPLVVAGELGKGRVVCLNYNSSWGCRSNKLVPRLTSFAVSGTPEPNPDCPTFDWWEYCWSLVIKSALWASGREPDLLIEDISVPGGPIPPGAVGNLVLQLNNTRASGTFDFELTVRDAWSKVEHRQTFKQDVPKGESEIKLPIDTAKISGGLHLADVIVRSGEQSVNWGTASFQVGQPVRIALAKLEKTNHIKSDTARASVAFENPLPPNPPRVIATLRDSRGRDLESKTLPAAAAATNASVEFSLAKVETVPFYVRFDILEGERRIDKKEARGVVAQFRPYDDFTYNIETYTGAIYYYEMEWVNRLRELGASVFHFSTKGTHGMGYYLESDIDLSSINGVIPDWTFKFNNGFVYGNEKPKTYAEVKALYQQRRDLKYLERQPCFNNPDYRALCEKEVDYAVAIAKPWGVWDYCIIDEMSLTQYGDTYDFCFCPHCMAKFREWAKGQYKDLAELNEAYGSDFKAWENVRPATYLEAKASGKWPGWKDHRKFMEVSLYEFYSWLRREFRERQPDAKISLSGTQAPHPYNGSDIWLRSITFDNLWNYQGGGQYALHRSFNTDMAQMPWLGYAGAGPGQARAIWHNALNRTHGVSYWWFYQILNPDWHLSTSGKTWDEEMPDLMHGIGKTILNADFDDYGIGIHYSQDSIHCSFALDAHDALSADRVQWLAAVERGQFQARFLSYAQLERGELQFPKVKLFILPWSCSLSDKEAETIREFARQGGTVVGDVQTGIYDPHMRPRTAGLLDDVFGIKRVNINTGYVEGNAVVTPPEKWTLSSSELNVKPAEPGIQLTTGKALCAATAAPALIRNSFGKGTAWYFNFDLSKLELLLRKQQHKPMMEVVDNILHEAGIKPFVTVTKRDGKPVDDCLVFAYHRGPIHYAGLLPNARAAAETNLPARLNAPEGLTLYDVRKGKLMENGDIDLPNGSGMFFALLPYKVTGISLAAPKTIRQGETIKVEFAVQADKGQPGDHVVRIATSDPSGKEIYYYTKNILTSAGKGSYDIPLALNASIGSWKISVRDIPSGTTKDATVNVEPGQRLPNSPQ